MSGRYKQGSCWDDRSCIEKILICAAVTTILIVIVLVILLTLYLTKDSFVPSPTAANIFAPEVCDHQTCLNHSSEIIERIDQTVNPCEDFYKFSCGNLLKKANGNEHLGSFFVIQSKSKRQIEDIYGEPIKDEEHKVVKISKTFYKNCLNETKIKDESLWNVKAVLAKIGGWPVIEGTKWDESRFWWIQTYFQLRKLGYFYASFLDISVVVDPANKDRSIYKASLPNLRDSHEYFYVKDKLGLMIDTAVALGAEKERATSEMSETYDFLLNLREQSYLRRNEDLHQRITVGEFQNQYEFINWLEFINNIIGPGVRIFKDDYVLFPSSKSIYKWFEYISTVPKRTQANYMMWKVIEELIPYLNISYNSKIGIRHGDYKTRSEFCIKQIRKKFTPSPIDIMYVRKYLPPEKKKEVKELIENLKLELLNLLEKHNWASYTDKQLAIERITRMNEIIGAPGNYFDDDIFEDLDFELNEILNSTNYFTSLFLLSKNHESWKFYQIYSTEQDQRIAQWNLQTSSVIGDYFPEENLLRIPATILQDVVFDEKRPNYLNYGSMGTLMGHHFYQMFGESLSISNQDGGIIDGWKSEFRNIFENTSYCLNEQFSNYSNINMYMIDLLLHQSLGLKIAYGAYINWINITQKEELKLQDVEYNGKQLFWISAASYFCQPLNSHNEEQNIFNDIVSGSMCNNHEFSNDFQCSLGSKMNPVNKCEIF